MNYQCLGDYIRDVNARNRDLKVTKPMDLNIDKHFMPSVANAIGTDLSTYKLVVVVQENPTKYQNIGVNTSLMVI